ncbi:hypothetical protein H0E87_031504 [Populus deltoides]|uniref:Uncharacterized protein n=1 Tax=Populus deltoides TaxID=3696 RepID=A0A8T2WFA8_POPDE|nr:hypothetical protein H0E87_031504 [Populus deltoides]
MADNHVHEMKNRCNDKRTDSLHGMLSSTATNVNPAKLLTLISFPGTLPTRALKLSGTELVEQAITYHCRPRLYQQSRKRRAERKFSRMDVAILVFSMQESSVKSVFEIVISACNIQHINALLNQIEQVLVE